MKKRFIIALFVMLLLALLASCEHKHIYGEWVIENNATCNENGSKVRVCECGETETKVIPASHTEGEWIIDLSPTLTTEGQRHKECLVCDVLLHDEKTPPLLSYERKEDGTYEIVGFSKDLKLAELIIPTQYNNANITSIGSNALEGLSISRLVLNSSIIEIKSNAFNSCALLNHVVWSNTIKHVDPTAFSNCTQLVEALPQTISENLTIVNTGKIYKANDTQINDTATLIINEGCVIIGGSIINNGTIKANGTTAAPVIFYNVDLPGVDNNGHGNIEFNNVCFSDGTLLKEARGVSIQLKGSYLYNVDFASYMWHYPQVSISDSVFESCGNLAIYSCGNVNISNTKFMKSGSIINGGTDIITVKDCMFRSPTNYVFKLQDGGIIYSENNDFGTTDENKIQDMFYDSNDDLNIDYAVQIIHTVSFISNGGTAVDTKKCSELLNAPNTTRNGYLFDGWFTDAYLKTPVVYPLKLTSDMQLYAKWIKLEDYKTCSNSSIKFLDSTKNSSVVYQITPTGFDFSTLAEKGYKLKIEVEYDVYYKKDYDMIWDIGYLGSPLYEVSIYNSDKVGQFKENLPTQKNAQTRTITYTTDAENYQDTIIYLEFSTDNIQNIIYFKNIKVNYIAYK